MHLEYAMRSDRGSVRGQNEDNCYADGFFKPAGYEETVFCQAGTCDLSPRLFAVCDGMGGEGGGEAASTAAATGLKRIEALCAGVSFDPDAVQQAVDLVNRFVRTQSMTESGKCGGSTLAALAIMNETYRTIHLGDSRVYLLRKGVFSQLTEDHSPVARMLRAGLITAEQALTHPLRSRLSRYLGTDPASGPAEADISDPQPLRSGDRFLLCSDGLWGALHDEQVSFLLSRGEEPAQIAETLVDSALDAGSRDNVTALVLFVLPDEGDLPAEEPAVAEEPALVEEPALAEEPVWAEESPWPEESRPNGKDLSDEGPLLDKEQLPDDGFQQDR